VVVVATAVALALLAAVAVAALTVGGVPRRTAVVTAALRATGQLALVGLVVAAAFRHLAGTAAYLAVMLVVATWTTTGRLRPWRALRRRVWPAVLAASATGATAATAVVLGLGALPREPRYLVAYGGITLGGTMSAATLTGRRLFDGLRRRRDEVEGWLALGATPRQAVAPLGRESVGEALLPGYDQTRTVGLVSLPGAFVGALAGGASPVTAAKFQLLVLVGLMAAQAMSGVVTAYALGAPRLLPPPD
jgi:putative ABC transport system permease protein